MSEFEMTEASVNPIATIKGIDPAIIAADGDEGYNFSVVNATLSAGATQRDQIKETAKAMKQFGVAECHVDHAR